MLQRFGFRNYRAFRSGSFQIKPITLLVGANSVGKSSLLSIPMLLRQTVASSDRSTTSALKLNGRDANIGESRNLFFQHNIADAVEFSIMLRDEQLFKHLSQSFPQSFLFQLLEIMEMLIVEIGGSAYDRIPKAVRRVMDSSILEDRQLKIDDIEGLINSVSSLHTTYLNEPRKDKKSEHTDALSMQRFWLTSRRRIRNFTSSFSRTSLRRLSKTDLVNCHKLIKTLDKLDEPSFTIDFRLRSTSGSDENRSVLSLVGSTIRHKDRELLSAEIGENGQLVTGSELVEDWDPTYCLDEIRSRLDFDSSIFRLVKADNPEGKSHIFVDYFSGVFAQCLSTLKGHFQPDSIGHVGPLRAHPKRFYFLDASYGGSADTDSVIEALREDDSLRDRVNGWLSKFGISINVSQYQQIVNRLAVRNIGAEFVLDITDVGFGISQLLPILVEGFLSSEGKTIVIEQPEIHLHPKMQGDLADLFIDITSIAKGKKPNGKRLVVETHSEYLLSRIRRRIADGTVRHSDVAIHYVERAKSKDHSIVENIYIPEGGAFKWPRDFYEDQLDDDVAYFRHNISSRKTSS